MSLAYNFFYLVRWLIFLIRWVLSLAYGVLQFISKPGSRRIVPILAAGAMYFSRPVLHPIAIDFLSGLAPTYAPQMWVLDAMLATVLLVTVYAYVLLSRMLAVVLSTFPPVTRPLPPMRRLRVTSRRITPAAVRMVVPRLPKRRWRLRLQTK